MRCLFVFSTDLNRNLIYTLKSKEVFLKTERLCQLLAVAVGARCAFVATGSTSGVDGLCYLEMARAYLRHDWHTAINGYWSPLYSWLLAFGMAVTNPKPDTEVLNAQIINFSVFVLCIFAFSSCWNALSKYSFGGHKSGSSIAEIYPAGWTICGYALLVTAAAWYIGALVPDMLVATIVFAAIAVLLRLEDGNTHAVTSYAALGALLAVGYYAKVILLYFGLLLIIGLGLQHFRKKSYARPAVALITFLLTISPFVFLLSKTLGRFTPGDTGRLSYAWLADVPETKTWLTGQMNAAPLPYYPGPLMHENPMVFRLPLLPGVTYAARYDPSRYDLSNRPHFSLSPQLKRIAINLRPFNLVVLGAEDTFLVLLVIFVLYSPREFLRRLAGSWFYSFPVLVIIAMYVLVFVAWRYLLAFSPLLWGTALGAISVPIAWNSTVRPIVLAVLIVFGLHVGPGLAHFLTQKNDSAGQEIAVAKTLSEYDIKPGDMVGFFGDGEGAWWAHLAGVSISAEIWPANVPQFWTSSPTDQQEILQLMINTGAKAVVWRRDSDQSCPSQWRALRESSGCIFVPSITP